MHKPRFPHACLRSHLYLRPSLINEIYIGVEMAHMEDHQYFDVHDCQACIHTFHDPVCPLISEKCSAKMWHSNGSPAILVVAAVTTNHYTVNHTLCIHIHPMCNM